MTRAYIVTFEPVLALTPENEGKYIAKVYSFEDDDKWPVLPSKRKKIALVGESAPEAALQFIRWIGAGEPSAEEAKALISKATVPADGQAGAASGEGT